MAKYMVIKKTRHLTTIVAVKVLSELCPVRPGHLEGVHFLCVVNAARLPFNSRTYFYKIDLCTSGKAN